MTALTLLDKLWQRHSVEALPDDRIRTYEQVGRSTSEQQGG